MKTNTTIGTTAAEAEALAATAAALAAGKDPFGDDDTDEPGTTTDDTAEEVVEATAAEDGDSTDNAESDADDGESAADDGEDAIAPESIEAVASDEPTSAQRYKVGTPEELKAQRAEQLDIKAKALKDLMDGVIEPEDYSRIEAEVTEALEGLAAQRSLHEANVQTAQQEQASALDKIIVAAKKAGEVDYRNDPKAAKQFDTAMAMLAQDGEERTYGELVLEAHLAVLALRGIKRAEPSPKTPPPRENGKGPLTLRSVPAAETPNSGGGWKEQLASLSGQAYEEAFAKLSPGQKAELMND